MLSHFQEYVRKTDFMSRQYRTSVRATTKPGCSGCDEEDEDIQQQHDWEMLLEYCRDHIGGGGGYGGLVAAALVPSIVLCDTDWNRHTLALKMLLLSPLALVACDRFVVSCSGPRARLAVHSLLCASTTLFSASLLCSALAQRQEDQGGLLELVLIFLPIVVLMLGMLFRLPTEWIGKSFAVSGCLCLAGWANTLSPNHLSGYPHLSDAFRAVMLFRFWWEKPRVWYWIAFPCFMSSLGRQRAPQVGQTEALGKKQLPSFAVEGMSAAATMSSFTNFYSVAFFAVCISVWNLGQPLGGWIFVLLDAIGPIFAIPLMIACFVGH
jgi:hypothetical protein